MFDYIYSFLYPAVSYIKIFNDLQIRELLRYQYEPLFRNQRIFKMIETEQTSSIYNISSAFNSVLVNKAHKEGFEVLADVFAAQ